MKRCSFRSRLALWSALLAGIALACFAGFAWLGMYDTKTRQVDTLLVTAAEREARRLAPPEVWKHIAADALMRTLGAQHPRQVLLIVRTNDGETLYRSPHWPAALKDTQLNWPPRPTPPYYTQFPGPPPRPKTALFTGSAAGTTWRIALSTDMSQQVAVGLSMQQIEVDMAAIRDRFLLALPLALALIAFGAWFVSGRALAPIRQLNEGLRNVTARGLDQHIATSRVDREFKELIEEINAMLARLEASFKQASRFSADASHELKTPLTILQGQIERAMHAVEAGSPIQATLTGILDEVRHLSGISRKLLLLSQADAGRLRLQKIACNLTEMLKGVTEDARMLAAELRIDSDIASGLQLQADEQLLRQLLINLISNAIKYNVPGGWIRIAAARLNSRVVVSVVNTSAGISPEAREHLFERFFRGDAAHSRNVEGVGLGLSLSREIARAHGGELTLNIADNNDVRLELVLPAS